MRRTKVKRILRKSHVARSHSIRARHSSQDSIEFIHWHYWALRVSIFTARRPSYNIVTDALWCVHIDTPPSSRGQWRPICQIERQWHNVNNLYSWYVIRHGYRQDVQSLNVGLRSVINLGEKKKNCYRMKWHCQSHFSTYLKSHHDKHI